MIFKLTLLKEVFKKRFQNVQKNSPDSDEKKNYGYISSERAKFSPFLANLASLAHILFAPNFSANHYVKIQEIFNHCSAAANLVGISYFTPFFNCNWHY